MRESSFSFTSSESNYSNCLRYAVLLRVGDSRDLPADRCVHLREDATCHDAATVRRLLAEAIAPTMEATVAALLRDPDHDIVRRTDGLTDAEFEALTDQLVNIAPSLPMLPDDAVSREGIYEDHS